MIMKIALLQTGKTNERYIKEGLEIYAGRIRKYSSFEIVTIPDLKNTRNLSPVDQKTREGEKIIGVLKNDDYVIVLDEKGKEQSTAEFSSAFGKMMMLPKKRIVFVIGGPWGCSEEVYRRADLRLSLSRMTFSHQLVRLLFLEQLYRVFTIIKGEPYHHE
jgi:23S rRNA (pseudouridine1915-N3)-methyltransferase